MNHESTGGLKRELRLFDGAALVVGSVIGSGIYLVPSDIAQIIHYPGLIFIVWIFTSFVAYVGALCYAELGGLFPVTGGEYIFIREAYGPFFSFLYGWIQFWVISSGCVATLAVACSMYILYLFKVGPIAQKFISVFFVFVLTVVNYRGIRFNALIQNVFAVIKVAVILGIVVIGFSLAKGDFGNIQPLFPAEFSWGILELFGLAMVATLWAYEGWHLVCHIGGEMKNPQRTVPYSLIIGLFVLVTVYLLVNMVYMYYMPIDEMAKSNFIAADVTQKFAGPIGGVIVTCVVLISMFSAAHANMITGPRVYFAMAQDKLFFNAARYVHPKYKSPVISVVFQGIWSAILTLLIGTFSGLFTFVVSAAAIYYAFTVSCIFILRKKYPDMKRPYKVWGYPVVPIAFIVVIIAFVIHTIVHTFMTEPKNALLFVFLILSGIPAYYYWSRTEKAASRKKEIK